jgi:hypothetical protein
MDPPHSSLAWCKSLWQTPENKISTNTSWERNSLLSKLNGSKDDAGLCVAYAFTGIISNF